MVYIDKDDDENQKLISKAADIRIAWGGLEAVSSVLKLPKNLIVET